MARTVFTRILTEFSEQCAEDYIDIKRMTIKVSSRTFMRLLLESGTMEILFAETGEGPKPKALIINTYGFAVQVEMEE